jgi:hypothetical protein
VLCLVDKIHVYQTFKIICDVFLIESKKSNGVNDDIIGQLRKVIRKIGELLDSFNLDDIIGFMRNLDLRRVTHHKMDVKMEKVLKEQEEERANEMKRNKK